MGFNFFRPLRAAFGILRCETKFLSLAPEDDKKCILSQAAALVCVFMKLAPWQRPQRDARLVSFWVWGENRKTLFLCWLLTANSLLFSPAAKKRMHMCFAPHHDLGVPFFTAAQAVTNGWPLSERRCSIAHICDSLMGRVLLRMDTNFIAARSFLHTPIASDTAENTRTAGKRATFYAACKSKSHRCNFLETSQVP